MTMQIKEEKIKKLDEFRAKKILKRLHKTKWDGYHKYKDRTKE